MIVVPHVLAIAKPASAPAFSLGSYSPKTWYDAGQIAGLNDGDAVGGAVPWNDLSGGGKNLAHGTAGFRPTYKTNIVNGKPVVRFLGSSSQRIYASDATMPTGDYTVLFVYKPTLDMANGQYQWLGGWGTSATNKLVVPYVGGVTSYGGNSLWGMTQSGDSGPDWTGWTANAKSCYNVWNVLLFTRTGNTHVFFKSTTTSSKTRTMTAAPQLGGEYIVGGWPNASGYATGDMAEHATWGRVLSGAEIAAIMTGLGAKYGITINT